MGLALRIDRDDEELTEREVSELTGVPLGTLRSRRARHLGLRFKRVLLAGRRNGRIRYSVRDVQTLLDAGGESE